MFVCPSIYCDDAGAFVGVCLFVFVCSLEVILFDLIRRSWQISSNTIRPLDPMQAKFVEPQMVSAANKPSDGCCRCSRSCKELAHSEFREDEERKRSSKHIRHRCATLIALTIATTPTRPSPRASNLRRAPELGNWYTCPTCALLLARAYCIAKYLWRCNWSICSSSSLSGHTFSAPENRPPDDRLCC